jgi:hypothetical protein
MSVFFDRVQRASFNQTDFPVNMIEIVGGLRDHIHEYPHSDGGIPEKLGRRLYTMKMHAVFDENISQYPGNYPDGLATLRSYFEAGLTASLVIPQLGTIQAYCRDWPQKWNWQVRSGEEADFTFIEDDQADTLDVFTSTAPTSVSMQQQLNSFNLEAEASLLRLQVAQNTGRPGSFVDPGLASTFSPSLIDQIAGAFNAVLALRDQEELAGIALEQKVASVNQYISQLNQAISSPLDHHLLDAAKALSKTATSFGRNAKATTRSIKTYLVPHIMSVTSISKNIFGDATHAIDILQMNPITDAFRVSAGTTITYIDTTPGRSSLSAA